MFSKKRKKISVSDNRIDSVPPFVIDLRELTKQSSPNEEKTEEINDNKKSLLSRNLSRINFNFISRKRGLKSLGICSKIDRPSRPIKTAISQKAKIKYLFSRKKAKKPRLPFFKFLFFRRPKAWQRRLNNFSSTIDSSKKSISKLLTTRKENSEALKLKWYRSVLSFIIVLILLIIPFKALDYWRVIDLSSLEERILSYSQAAIDNFMSATQSARELDLDQAGHNFSLAAGDFVAAANEISQFNSLLLSLASWSADPKLRLASASQQFLAAGGTAAELGENLSLAFESLFDVQEGEDWSSSIDNFIYHLRLSIISADRLNSQLAGINLSVLPTDYRQQFEAWQGQADGLKPSLEVLLTLSEEIKNFLGFSANRRYLLVFQNNTEMRGSGGFMGSYAIADFRSGHLENLEVPAGGTYDTEAGMRSFIRSPRPLWLVNPRWYFWDANWWPDWPMTARNLMWFYEKSDGPTVDGVISFTPDVLEDLLLITGAINLQEEYGIEVDADNFWQLIQSIVEKDNLIISHPEAVADLPDSPVNQPKKIIGDLFNEILNILPEKLEPKSFPSLLSLIEKNLRQKNILFYFDDPNFQNKLADWRLDGAIYPARHDYLLVVHSNIAGQKSDREMEAKVFLDSQILANGSIINELTIIRRHQGIKNQPMTGVRNVDWLRVYVPQGSQLISASGFSIPDSRYFELPEDDWEVHPILATTEEKAIIDPKTGVHIYQEKDKTVFANWVMTDPGQSSIVKIRYSLPIDFKLPKIEQNWQETFYSLFNRKRNNSQVHSLVVQKQPGLSPYQFFTRLRLPLNWKIDWRHPDSLWEEDAWLDGVLLDQDYFWAISASPIKD